MTTIGLFFLLFAIVVLLSPLIASEDRPDFRRPDRKARSFAAGLLSGRRTS